MRFLSYAIEGRSTYGVIRDDGIVDLGARLEGARSGGGLPSLKSVIAAGEINRAMDLASTSSADHNPADISYLPTIPDAGRYICIGVNYANRNAEYKDNSDLPKYPSVFMRTAESFVGHGQAILRPPESPQLDYEGEIVIIVGKAGRRIPEERALDYIAGLTIMNEGTIRDWVRHAKFNVTQGKNFEKTGSIGPWMVSADECPDFDNLTLTTRVNDEPRQSDTTANLMFPFAYLIHYLSTFMTLKPGDVIATGTPNGAGARFDPPIYLKPGDRVDVSVSGIGTLSNPVEDEIISQEQDGSQ